MSEADTARLLQAKLDAEAQRDGLTDLLRQVLTERDSLREAIEEHIKWHGDLGHESLRAALHPTPETTEDR